MGDIINGGFEWDEDKAQLNVVNHDVAFEEAAAIFGDPFVLFTEDPAHSIEEKRFLAFGVTPENRFLVVSYTERADRVRLISAREGEPHERRAYEQEEL